MFKKKKEKNFMKNHDIYFNSYSLFLQESNYLIDEFDVKFRSMIAAALNNITKEPQPTEVIRENDPVSNVYISLTYPLQDSHRVVKKCYLTIVSGNESG